LKNQKYCQREETMKEDDDDDETNKGSVEQISELLHFADVRAPCSIRWRVGATIWNPPYLSIISTPKFFFSLL
jgi:hypothetical protein